MNHFGAAHCLNTHDSIVNRQKAYTLGQNDKVFIMDKYFRSLPQSNYAATNYANVPPDHEISPPSIRAVANQTNPKSHHHRQVSRHSHHSRSQHLHSRSHSQHYYQTMHHHQLHPSFNDPNYYYNLTNPAPQQQPPPPITGSRHSPPISKPLLNNRTHLDCITVMQVCNEMGNNIDSAPPMPVSRQYSIVMTENGCFKVGFPQTRTMTKNFQDPITKLFIKAGEMVSVLGVCKEDRSKFTICYRDQHFDVPHQFTRALAIQTRY